MFAQTYFDNAVRCFSRWLEMVATDPVMAVEYHSRGRELVATAARIKGVSESHMRRSALVRAAFL